LVIIYNFHPTFTAAYFAGSDEVAGGLRKMK